MMRRVVRGRTCYSGRVGALVRVQEAEVVLVGMEVWLFLEQGVVVDCWVVLG